MIFIALLAQASTADLSAEAVKQGLEAQNVVYSKMFDCMDEAVKVELKAHITDATPETVTDAALKTCSPVSDEMRSATTKLLSNSWPPEKARSEADRLTNDELKGLRQTYIGHVDKILAKPQFSEIRLKVSTMEWSKCVRVKVLAWSKLKEDAKTIAAAAVTSCQVYRSNLRTALRYSVRGQKLPLSSADDIEASLAQHINENAVSWVVEERAKSLPK